MEDEKKKDGIIERCKNIYYPRQVWCFHIQYLFHYNHWSCWTCESGPPHNLVVSLLKKKQEKNDHTVSYLVFYYQMWHFGLLKTWNFVCVLSYKLYRVNVDMVINYFKKIAKCNYLVIWDVLSFWKHDVLVSQINSIKCLMLR